MVFDLQWFEQHQSKLLWLLNNPILKYWFRWSLRIRPHDCPYNVKINRIEPDKFWFAGNKKTREIKVDIRTHAKFAKRLYCAFRLFWYVLHATDFLMNRARLELNFGFDTLTAYPDAGSGGTTVDGVVSRDGVDEGWATIVAGVGTTVAKTDTLGKFAGLYASATENQFSALNRSAFTFDTSSINGNAVISAAALSLYGNDHKYVGLGEPSLLVTDALIAANNDLAASDFGNIYVLNSYGIIANASWSTSAYNEISLNTSSITKASITKLGTALSFENDRTNYGGNWIPLGEADFYGYFADQAGTTNDPKLVVTYTLPTFIPKITWY